MLLVFTSEELERIVVKYSTKRPKIEFLGENQLRIKISGMRISLFLREVLPRKISFIYKMGSIVNFFAEKFVNLSKPGIMWDKESKLINIDLDLLDQDVKLSDFYIRQLIFDTKKMVIDFDLKDSEETKKA